MTLRGVFAPIPTPFGADEGIDRHALSRNVDRWMRTPLAGLVVLGSTGEAPLLEDAEADEVIATVRDGVPAGRPLIAGTGRESTPATVAACHRAARLGVDAVLVRTPAFFKNVMTADALVRHYTAVADASPVPVLLYNVTMYTGVNLSPDAVARLSTHPNIAGMKESAADIAQISQLVSGAPEGFSVLAGSATTFFAALVVGACGGVLALSAVVPDLCVQLYEWVQQRRYDDARALQQRLTPLARLLGAAHGVSGVKFALDRTGGVGGAARAPLGELSAEAKAQIQEQLALVAAVGGPQLART